MSTKQVDKSIRQMRQIFGFFAIGSTLGVALTLIAGLSEPIYLLMPICYVPFAACLWVAFVGLGKRNPTGLTFARISSVLFLFGFPILTIFGISYLIKLSKPEMKQALGAA